MDPNQTVADALYAIQRGDFGTAIALLIDVQEWIDKDGFFPTNAEINRYLDNTIHWAAP